MCERKDEKKNQNKRSRDSKKENEGKIAKFFSIGSRATISANVTAKYRKICLRRTNQQLRQGQPHDYSHLSRDSSRIVEADVLEPFLANLRASPWLLKDFMRASLLLLNALRASSFF